MQLPRPPKMPSPLPMDLEGSVRLGVKTLLAILIAVVTGVVSIMGAWGSLAGKRDIKELLYDHETSSAAHPQISEALKQIEEKALVSEGRTKRLEERQYDTQQDVAYIRARIDFLTEQTVRQAVAQRSTQNRGGEAAARAVQRLRAGDNPSTVLGIEEP